MAGMVKVLQKLTGNIPQPCLPRKTCFDFSHFAAGDRVYVNRRRKLSKPLLPGGKLELPDGFICHDDIIGGGSGQAFRTNKGIPYRITFPDLDTYISSMPRKVTPVYSTYANHIVSLFDTHIVPPSFGQDRPPPLEILDAGTGHGSVALHLARAVQAANPPIPDIDLETSRPPDESGCDGSPETRSPIDDETVQIWQDWRKSRRAVVHSVEISPVYSRHAERKVVGGFRRGLYLPHIDFCIADVNDWVDQQLGQRSHEPFLSYVFLDMPGSHRYLQRVASAMKDNALIAVFVPSITQIGDCVQQIKANALPLIMEKAVELGDGISNGRLWDVRLAWKRAKDRMDISNTAGSGRVDEQASAPEETVSPGERISACVSQNEDGLLPCFGEDPRIGDSSEGPVMVCRPKVGERVIGGGFVGLWRRMASD